MATEATENEPTENENAQTTPPASKNVSMEDFQALKEQFEAYKNDHTAAATTEETPKPVDDKEQTRIDGLQKKIDEMTAANEHSALIATQAAAAQASGIDMGDLAPVLLGKDADTTKSNVKAFGEFLKAHDAEVIKKAAPSMVGGFHVSESGTENTKDFMGQLMKKQFGEQK